MNPNIYDFAHTEYAQDAFIAWLCANYQSANVHKKQISEQFMKSLLGINVPFSHVEADTQVKNIDVLLTLDHGKYYVIIEDKKFSNYHSNQLDKYISSLISSGISQQQIFVVYYKTGHISVTPNGLYGTPNGFVYDPGIQSEMQLVNNVRNKYGNLLGFKICDLPTIDAFFKSVAGPIGLSGSEILEDYADSISRQNAKYSSAAVPVMHGQTEPIWGRVFDDYINKNGRIKFPNLIFKLDLYSGHYWEIYIASPMSAVPGVQNAYSLPFVNVRADLFQGKTQRICFFNHNSIPNLPTSGLKLNTYTATYSIPWGKFRRKSLNGLSFSGSTVNINDIFQLLDAICDEFDRFVVKGGPGPFAL